jgi:hypothetical protein
MDMPSVVIIGVEPADSSHGWQLSPTVARALPEVIGAIESEFRSHH